MCEGDKGELYTEPTEVQSSLERSGGPMNGVVLAAMLNSTLPWEPFQDSLQNGTSTARELIHIRKHVIHNKYEILRCGLYHACQVN